jgi:hypothetical protein
MSSEIQAKTSSSFIDRLQRDSFRYFLDLVDSRTGLIPDSSLENSPASITGVGFALTCYPIGVERKFMTRAEAIEKTLTVLKFFAESEQSDQPTATGYQGFYYHFLDMKTGQRVWDCELSFIDTGFLLAGALCAGIYFDQQDPKEKEIRRLADFIYSRVNWQWAMGKKKSLSQGWRPDSGYISYDWEGYSEALLLYALGLGSISYPLPAEAFEIWTSTYQWENIYDVDHLYAGPLFIHQFSHAWIDFRNIRDKFMREKNCDYFENSRRALKVQREYCIRNPRTYEGYGKNCWGVTADLGPQGGTKTLTPRRIDFRAYAARSVPYGPDDGTLAPSAALASIAFDREMSVAVIEHMRDHYPRLLGRYGFTCSFNLSTDPAWFPEHYYALDIGISQLMIENSLTELTWNLMKKSPVIKRGLERGGFAGGWL